MASYLQFGHASWNLLEEQDIGSYSGLVLSPVNDGQRTFKRGWRGWANCVMSLSSSLTHRCTTQRSTKARWISGPTSQQTLQRPIMPTRGGGASVVARLLSKVLSLAWTWSAHRRFPREPLRTYSLMVEVADDTKRHADGHGMEMMLTAILSLRDLANPTRAMAIASILLRSSCERIYLTFLNEDVPPREPLRDGAGIPTAVHLISLHSTEMRVHVAFVSHDLVL